MGKIKFYENGLRFECTGCGACCRIEDGYVEITLEELSRVSDYLGLEMVVMMERYILRQKEPGIFEIKSGEDRACIFLKENRCQIYDVRPNQCQTFPFWPENLKSKYRWHLVSKECPGIGKGPVFSKQEIESILHRQVQPHQHAVGDSYEKEDSSVV